MEKETQAETIYDVMILLQSLSHSHQEAFDYLKHATAFCLLQSEEDKVFRPGEDLLKNQSKKTNKRLNWAWNTLSVQAVLNVLVHNNNVPCML